MFKQLFGQPSRKHITIAFLNDLLRRKDDDRITDLTFENTEYIKETEDGKTVRLDFAVLTNADENINVEVQVTNQHNMQERTLYYWAKMFSNTVHSGESYVLAKPTIMISILNYPLFPSDTDSFHTTFHIKEDTEHFDWSNHLEFHVFDLSAFMVQWRKYRRKIKALEKSEELPWLMMLSAADFKKKKWDEELMSELEEWAMNKEQVREALIEWETLSANKENRKLYEARKKELMDLLSNLEGAQRLGEEKGKKEVAIKMFEKGYDISTIAEITDLSEQEIQRLIIQN